MCNASPARLHFKVFRTRRISSLTLTVNALVCRSGRGPFDYNISSRWTEIRVSSSCRPHRLRQAFFLTNTCPKWLHDEQLTAAVRAYYISASSLFCRSLKPIFTEDQTCDVFGIAGQICSESVGEVMKSKIDKNRFLAILLPIL